MVRVYRLFQEEAKKYLGCPTLTGVEADSAEKIHLNEYIYGVNFLTGLSRSVAMCRIFWRVNEPVEGINMKPDILRPWYRVNRSAIRLEHEALWYGRDWGCTFAERSCFDFIRERTRFAFSLLPATFLEAYPLTNAAASSQLERMGSPSKWRFCPMAKVGRL
ncbi:unnamed protein product [Haemonchus placei]|uniref:Uncharacterized protein n=1 Tax=Haemonchus placei TaxID=6290 RepID=A0A3P7YED5_HAEPC|nr:unnamed protein product [Haemonchus placei]